MKILYFALFLAAVAVVFVLLHRAVRKTAYPLAARYLHCRLIPAVLLALLVLTNVYTVSYPLEWLDNLINHPVLANFFQMILPNRAYELIYMLLVLVGLNIIVLLLVEAVLLLTKLIFLRAGRFVDIEGYTGFSRVLHLPWLMTGWVYDYQNGEARLNGRGATAGLWAGGMKRVFLILWIAELLAMAASILWGTEDWNTVLLSVSKSWYLLPMAGFLLLEQVELFLQAPEGEEAGTFGSADIGFHQSGSMTDLWNDYKNSFSGSEALLFSEMGGNHVPAQSGLGSSDLGNQQLEDCSQPDVLHVISGQLRECGARQSEPYQNALVELLNGRSINICDCSEGEFLIALCAYLNFYMSQGRTALMLCSDRKQAEHMCAAVNREFRRLNSLYSIWSVTTLEDADANGRLSMLVCAAEDLVHYHLTERRQDFTDDLFCVILADGTELFARDSICLERIFGTLRRIEGIRQYVAFTPVNNDALRTAMEQVIGDEMLPFSNDSARNPYAGVMIWRGESFYRLQQQLGIGDNLSPYLGAAIPLALVAVKYDFPRVHIVEDDACGDRSFHDVLAMSSREVTDYLGVDINLRSVIRTELEEALAPQELSVTVVHDTDYNFFNALWLWTKYGGSAGSLLHVVSPPYVLREFFAANFNDRRLHLKNNEFDALISNRLGAKLSHMAVLLVMLCDKGMTETELMERSREYRWDYENVDQLLQDCLQVVLTREEVHSVYECFHFEEEKRFREDLDAFEVQTRITLIDTTIRRRLQGLVGYAQLVSRDTRSLPVLYGNIYNYYLRGQIISVDGYLYQIRSIGDGRLHADQLLPQEVPDYFQISDFQFRNYTQTDSCVDTGFLDMNLCTADVTRTVYGYWSCNRGNSFAANCSLQLNNLGEPVQTRMEGVNILEISVRRGELGDRPVEAMRLFAYLIKELAKTLFPATHQNLFAAVSEGYDETLLPRVLETGRDCGLEDLVCSLIPGVSGAPEPGADRIAVYVVESSCMEYGMVQMLLSRYKNVLLMMREYLSWYLGDGEDAKGRYLHFGADAVPAVLAVPELLALCRKVMPEVAEQIQPAAESKHSNVPRCVFCGRRTMFPKVLSDSRKMCRHCADHQVTQKDEIRFVFRETVRYLTEGYGISLPTNLHVRFQSADAIKRAAGNVDGGRILGFYNSGNRQLWLEARGPRIALQSTLIHELTHAWQHHDPEFVQLLPKALRKFPLAKRKLMRLLLLEGHAVFMEVETMRRMQELAYSRRLQESYLQRDDEYGRGYRLVHDYILDQSQAGSYMTPFAAMNQLLRDIIDGKVTIS